MIEEELIQIWQSSPKHEQIKFEKSKLMLDVQSKLKSFEGILKFRDYTEIGTGIILIPLLVYEVFRQPLVISKVGALWLALWIMYVIYRLLKIKMSKPAENTIFLEYLKKTKLYLIRHKSMSDNVLSWYILPSIPGIVLFVIGLLDLLNKPVLMILQLREVWVFLVMILLITIYTKWITNRLTKKVLDPRIEKVDELLNSLMREE